MGEKEEFEEFRKLAAEEQSGSFTRAAAYTNLVTLGGYAGAFTLWGYARPNLTADATMLVALLVGMSLMIFLCWNVFMMVRMALMTFSVNRQMRGLLGKKFRDKYLALVKKNNTQPGWLMMTWGLQVTVAILTAFSGVLLLLYNCAAFVFHLPVWPR